MFAFKGNYVDPLVILVNGIFFFIGPYIPAIVYKCLPKLYR
jgi:hypothetical protein